MKYKEEEPLTVDLLLAIYLLVGLIVLIVGIVALSDDMSAVSDADRIFVWFFMILGSIMSLLTFLLMFRGKPSSWYVASGVAIIKLVYCVFFAITQPGEAGVLVVAFLEVLMLGLIMAEPTRTYLLE